ncbi:hypothetical protein B0A49_10729 [Cryomyces minteri]|uniref:Uncharacterized protein n=1 Tax=Cryomyces minteri TaxID=331657 RepID=A0A4U0W7K7_9PEZI|nr:hypothetical protein B0A49_10729 [Cryomyces minteri]
MLYEVVFLALGVIVIALVKNVYNKRRSEQLLAHILTHTFLDGDNSRKRYLSDLKTLLESGYQEYQKNEQAFKITIPVGGYSVKYRVILPKSHLEEIKHLSNNVFSCRYFAQSLPQYKGHAATINLMEFFVPTITSLTNALLVDSRLSSDPEWLQQTADFAVNRYGAADDVRQWPPCLAGLIAPFIPSVKRLREQRTYVMQKMKPIYDELKGQSLLSTDDKKNRRKGTFGYEWLWSGAPDDVTLQDFSDTMMRTLIAAIHTTAKTISVAFIDVLTQPEFLAELTREAREAVEDDGQSINLDKLLKLDCFLKESQRLSPVFLFTMNRILTQDYEFKCSGLKLPKETMITAPAAAIATDPEIFREPNTFDGHRYMRLREEHKESASSLVLGMSTIDSLGFGLGNQACPGRFLAVNNLKLMMAKLMISWELTLEKNGQEFQGPRPSMEYKDFSVVPPSQFSIRLKKL